MENKETTQMPEKTSAQKKPKKKECTAGQTTNIAFASIALLVICISFIAIGIYFLAGIKAYLGGVLLIVFGIAFAVIDFVLNKSTLFKKTEQSKIDENK